jgi:Family of unknown function (DUF5906)
MSDNVEKGSPGAGTNTGAQGQKTTVNLALGAEVIPEASGAGDQNCLLLGRTDDAEEFLERWRPGGPWVLTSIVPDGGKTTTRTFGASERLAMRDWIEERQGRENIYFSVNDLSRAVSKKAGKDDVAALRALHVDVDPRPGEPLDAERRRAEKLLREFKPAPTVIIDSGGGYQGFWFGEEPEVLPAPDTPEREGAVKDAELRNLKIETALQADACHNIDRIMRLPGTINVPNKKKLAKGRVPALARVVEADWSRRYVLDAFPRAAAVASAVAPREASPPVAIPDLIGAEDARLLDPSPLERAVIMHGMPPDEPGRFPSRSEAMFYVLCARIRAGVPDDVLAAMLLDRSFGISAHVLEQPGPERYAARQIQRAHAEALDPELAELNLRHVVLLNEQGKTRVLEFVRAPIGNKGEARSIVTLQSFDDFRNRYMNRPIQVATDKDGNAVKKPLGEVWLRWANRRQHHSLVFAPGEGEEVGDQLNLWRGFGVVPKAGDWTRMRSHVRNILAGGDDIAADYIIRWAAFAVQYPALPAEVALVFRGKKGTGKGLFARALGRMFGQHGLHIGGGRLLTGRFNLHLRDCCLLFADEVEWRGDREAEAALKEMITEPSLQIEGKGTNSFASPNHLHIVMASNEDWVVPASIDERRFAAFAVSDEVQGNKDYFTSLVSEIDSGGLGAMLHDLLAMDLNGWHPRWSIPQTGELMAQKLASLSGAAAVVHELLMRGETPLVERDDGRWPTRHEGGDVFMPTSDLIAWALARRLISEVKPGLNEQIGRELKRAAPPEWECRATRETVQGRQVRGRWLPSLPEARRLWAESRGVVVEWGEGAEAAWDVASGPPVASASELPF